MVRLALIVMLLVVSCRSGSLSMEPGKDVQNRPIEDVLAEKSSEWMKIEGVVGVGQGEREGKPCLLVLVSRPLGDYADVLPESVDGYAVITEETDPIRAR